MEKPLTASQQRSIDIAQAILNEIKKEEIITIKEFIDAIGSVLHSFFEIADCSKEERFQCLVYIQSRCLQLCNKKEGN